jgi:hypothetical protein
MTADSDVRALWQRAARAGRPGRQDFFGRVKGFWEGMKG